MLDQRRAFRACVLASFDASGPVIEELLAHGGGGENRPARPDPTPLPLAPEPHVADWHVYAAEAADRGAWEVLRPRLPQLQFPVRAWISQTEAYRAATRRGVPLDVAGGATGLGLRSPDRLRLWVQDSLAGPVPVLGTGDRADFVLLVQALSCRNEPLPVPDSVAAFTISGFNNWDRIRQHRRRWLDGASTGCGGVRAAATLRVPGRLIPQKELYQDRFLILAEGPYSNVPAGEMGLPGPDWLRLSGVIRLAHECTHYLTLRLFSSMCDHPLDELIADYVGIATACGRYRADWFLRFVGLEDFPQYREGGRLEYYRGRPPLSDAAFRVLQRLVRAAAENLERFDFRCFSGPRQGQDRMALVPLLYQSTLEELASGAGPLLDSGESAGP